MYIINGNHLKTKLFLYIFILCFTVSCGNNTQIKSHNPFQNIELNPSEELKRLKLFDLNNETIDINTYLKKPLLIVYWATWCRYCKGDFPELKTFTEQHNQNINVLFISDESVEKINSFKTKTDYTFNFITAKNSFSKFGIRQRPAYSLFHPSGKHLETVNGSVDAEILNEMLEYHQLNF